MARPPLQPGSRRERRRLYLPAETWQDLSSHGIDANALLESAAHEALEHHGAVLVRRLAEREAQVVALRVAIEIAGSGALARLSPEQTAALDRILILYDTPGRSVQQLGVALAANAPIIRATTSLTDRQVMQMILQRRQDARRKTGHPIEVIL